MSDNSDNPFSPSRRQGEAPRPESQDSLNDLVPKDEGDEYRLDYRAEDYDYDPDEILDDEEEPGGAGWSDPMQGMSAQREPGATPSYNAAPGRPDEPDDLLDDNADEDDAFEEDDGDYESADGEEDDDWEDDDDSDGQRNFLGPWPLGLIAAGIVALILLAVGGFGVLQERAALREEIRDLRSQLAVAVAPDQLSQERSTQRELVERNDALNASLETLRLENRQLSDTVAGLESQLEAQQAAAQKADVASKPAPKPTPEPAPATKAPAASNTTGDWFVNFGSYRQRDLAYTWARRLQPAAGKVSVQAAPGGDLYRVRVVSLPDRATARAVASALQSEYDLPELWVGED